MTEHVECFGSGAIFGKCNECLDKSECRKKWQETCVRLTINAALCYLADKKL